MVGAVLAILVAAADGSPGGRPGMSLEKRYRVLLRYPLTEVFPQLALGMVALALPARRAWTSRLAPALTSVAVLVVELARPGEGWSPAPDTGRAPAALTG